MSPLLSRADLLARLNCRPDKLRSLLADPDDPLPSISLRGMIRFDPAAVDAWLRRQSFKQPRKKGKRKMAAVDTSLADEFLKGGR